jgi:hypothetical protein
MLDFGRKNLQETALRENLDVGQLIRLKRIFEILEMIWSGFIWLRMTTNDWLL